jgi:hypothetical protein
MKVNREAKRICLECSKYINIKKDKHVIISTINREISNDDHSYFHFQCWVDYFNKRVNDKMRTNVSFMQDKVMTIFTDPSIKKLLSQVKGSDMVLNMASMPLDKKKADPVLKNIIKNKVKNGKRRKKK